MATMTIPSVSSPDLFQDEVPVLRPSLVRHGLVDLAYPPLPRLDQPRSSEDLKAADVEASDSEEGEGGWVRAGGPEDHDREDSGLEALLGVDNFVVSHFRAAVELRRTLLSPASPRDNPRTPGRTSRRKRSSSAVSLSVVPKCATDAGRRGGGSGGSGRRGDGDGGGVEHGASRTASAAASAAVAAARRVEHDDSRKASSSSSSKTGAASPSSAKARAKKEGFSSWSMSVSSSAVLDIAVKLFGSTGSPGTCQSVPVQCADGLRASRCSRHSISGKGRGDSKRTAASTPRGSLIGGSGGAGNDLRLATFTVDVHTGGCTRLGVGVKELGGGAVVVQDLHRLDESAPGPAERAGVAVGDVILGINYLPLEKGLANTASLLAEAIKRTGFVKLQISRHVHADNRRQTIPGRDCPVVTELMWRTAQLRRGSILDSGERYKIAGFVLQLMAWDEGMSVASSPPPPMLAPLSLASASSGGDRRGAGGSSNGGGAAASYSVPWSPSTQLDSLVLRVKGLREGIYVRCLHAKSTLELAKTNTSSMWGAPASDATVTPNQRATVRYVLRAEDIATGREWLVFPRYSDFSELHRQLLALWPPLADLPFPSKLPVASLLPGASGVGSAMVEERIVGLEAFMHGALTLLGIYASVDPRCSEGLRMIQDFLGMPRDLFLSEVALPPALCEQKRVELLLYKLLNQFDSPASKLKHRLMRGFAEDLAHAPDVDTLMKRTSTRLTRLQEFLHMHYQKQLAAYLEKSDLYTSPEAKKSAIRKAIRRQVELSLFLPLRRCLCNELTTRLRVPSRNIQQAIKKLRNSPPSVFGVDYPDVLQTAEFAPAREEMGQATRRLLPADQIDGLSRAAEHLAALHASLHERARGKTGRRAHRAPPGAAKCFEPDAGDPEADVAVPSPGQRNFGAGGDGDPLIHVAAWRAASTNGLRLDVVANGSDKRVDGVDSLKERDGTDPVGSSVGIPEAVARLAMPNGVHVTGEHRRCGGGGGDDSEGLNARSCALGLATGRGSPNTTISLGDYEIDDRRRPREVDTELCRPSPLAGTSRFVGTSHDNDDRRVRESGSSRNDRGGFSEGVREGGNGDANTHGGAAGLAGEEERPSAMGADDFLPLFAIALVHSAPLDLLVPQTLLTYLMDEEGSLSEEGYLVATLEAAVSFIAQVSASCGE